MSMAKLREYRRVISFAQVLYMLGRKLKRQGVRYTTLAAVICGSVILVDVAGNRILNYDLPWKSVNMAAIPGLVALFTLGIGNLLASLSNMFSSERLLLADANSMNLMEDCKKADMHHHLEVLWDRAFKYEAKLRGHGTDTAEAKKTAYNRATLRELVVSLDAECKEHFGVLDDNVDEFVGYAASFRPLSQRMPTTKEGFMAAAGFALPRALPQKLQEALSGCDLSLVEDWYDGAFFTVNDRKLQEQFVANKTIRGIRQTIGISMSVRFVETLIGHPVPLWHGLTMKKIGTSVGTLMARMNRKYVKSSEPGFFDAQHFLWHHEQNDLLILRTFGDRGEDALRDVRQSRRTLFRDIFSNDRLSAHAHICRMFGRDFVNAMNLRLDYDVEFAAGMLDRTPIRDIRDLAEVVLYPVYSELRANLKADRARQVLRRADDFLKKHIPEIFDNPLGLRAARVGSMTNPSKLLQMMVANPTVAVSIFRERIIASEPRYTKRICLLRQHYELARLQLLSYIRMVDELAEFDHIARPNVP
ncbi:MAG: hypothetical protein JSW66_11135 [Phycisphaerales bacterium]|nr:MAG: hypothetical protein JSW66_11135 [Phycisphaerales bacterium]